MKIKTPYSELSYWLDSCRLTLLNDEHDARVISNHFSQIDPWRTLNYSSEAILKYLLRHDPALRRYVIMKEEQNCGVIAIRYPWLRGAYIEMFGIFESYQRIGIGGEVIRWAEEQSKSEASNLWVMVSEFNPNAIHFYEQKGFIKIALLPDLIKPGFNELFYRKSI